MKKYRIVYVVESSQEVAASSIDKAASYAQTYATQNKLKVLSIIEIPVAPLPAPAPSA